MGYLKPDQRFSSNMKFLLIVAALLGLSYAQDCGSCGGDRASETGCKLFCYLDIDSDGLIDRDNFIAVFNSWNGGNPVGADIFVPEIISKVGLCQSEAELIFGLFAGVGGSDPSVIEEVDMTTLFEAFELITGQTQINYEEFVELYGILFDLIQDPNCS